MDLSFAYANARVKGMKNNLLTREAVRKLLDVRTLDEIAEPVAPRGQALHLACEAEDRRARPQTERAGQ